MPDLAEWLETAIRVREKAAEAATPGPWVTDRLCFVESRGASEVKFVATAADVYADGSSESILQADAEHIVLNDPDTVLRRCAADRKIFELHGRMLVGGPNSPFFNPAYVCLSCEPTQFADNAWPCQTIRALAEGYGYQEVS